MYMCASMCNRCKLAYFQVSIVTVVTMFCGVFVYVCVYVSTTLACMVTTILHVHVQWNPSIPDTLGTA
jgi:hypothetical protein